MTAVQESPTFQLLNRRELGFRFPESAAALAYDEVYNKGIVQVGWPDGARRLYTETMKQDVAGFFGVQLGDEGKGRFIDNKIQAMLHIPGIKTVYAIRFQGGANAGHTVIPEEGRKHAFHHVPSGILYPEVVNVMDQGMVIHMEDLRTEIEDVEADVGDIRGRLFLSQDAALCTDLERAEEGMNRMIATKSKGGTGTGMAPTYGRDLMRTGKHVEDLFKDDWREKFGEYYDQFAAKAREVGTFIGEDLDIKDFSVADLRQTRKNNEGKPPTERKRGSHKVGTKEEFLDRLADQRAWFIARDESNPERPMITNTTIIHQEMYDDTHRGVLFEGSQATGIKRMLGRKPDVSSSDTTAFGVMEGTGIWRTDQIANAIGVFKGPYMSSVGSDDTEMMTQVFKKSEPETEVTWEQLHAKWIQEEAQEYGTTTGRPREICWIDLPMLNYNAQMTGIQVLAATHLDVAKENVPIKICDYYTDASGNIVRYQPGLKYQKGLKPHYMTVDGWNAEDVKNAKSFDQLPDNAKKFMAFMQGATGYPIIAATTGPERDNMITMKGYDYRGPRRTRSHLN